MHYDTKDTWLPDVKPRLYFVILFIIHLGYLKPMSKTQTFPIFPWETKQILTCLPVKTVCFLNDIGIGFSLQTIHLPPLVPDHHSNDLLPAKWKGKKVCV